MSRTKPKTKHVDTTSHVDGNIAVHGIQSEDAAIVSVGIDHGGVLYAGAGTSKRASGDVRNTEFGFKLALVRALQGLMDELLESEGYYFED